MSIVLPITQLNYVPYETNVHNSPQFTRNISFRIMCMMMMILSLNIHDAVKSLCKYIIYNDIIMIVLTCDASKKRGRAEFEPITSLQLVMVNKTGEKGWDIGRLQDFGGHVPNFNMKPKFMLKCM